MKKITIVLIVLVLIIIGLGIYKFNFTNDDIYNEKGEKVDLVTDEEILSDKTTSEPERIVVKDFEGEADSAKMTLGMKTWNWVNTKYSDDKKKGFSLSKKKESEVPGYITTRGDSKFMNAEISDTAFYHHLLSEYQSNYMVSINQMEIKTNYSSCIDIANKVYRREVILHYSIYNEKGIVIDGNFLVAYFPSNSNKDTDIAERTFPELAEMLKSQLQSIVK